MLAGDCCPLLLRLMRAVLTQPGDKPRRRRGSAGAALREERSRGMADVEPAEPQPEARSLYSGTTPAERRERWRAGAVDVMGGHSQQLSKERRRRKSSDRVELPRAPGGI